jgi:hypothetical protein
MYKDMVQPVVDRFCQGYNGCILAYGQTGALLLPACLLKWLMCVSVSAYEQQACPWVATACGILSK